ncbi:MAG: LD-carboxypeptidase [Bacteroidia bacterium]|jgi:muramoyltetrapeptide carboxypeptidase|nr:LD-carboxypeptidase [Bacteroidia bacterium]
MELNPKRIPPFLKPGDTIAIAAPARKIAREELEPAAEMLRGFGFRVVYNEALFGAENQFSGSDAARTADLQHWINAADVQCILSARGGYGTLRIVDSLDFAALEPHPKWIAGFSDVTVLHSHLHTLGHATLHCTMPINFGKDAESVRTLVDALCGRTLHYTAANTTAAPNRTGIAEGILTGGNLSLLYALNGSASAVNTRGKILYIEDLDEYLYHIDRMMLSLKRAGHLSGLAGLLVGGMSDMKDNAVPFGKTAEEIIFDAVREYDYPVAFGFPAGHESRNMALRLGVVTKLEVADGECSLRQDALV